MKVRVKEDCSGFFGGELRKAGDTFTIEARTHATRKDANGKPLVISAQEQFSETWMEVIEVPKAKPGPKPKVVEE